MRIGLIDVDGHNFPNIPLMKISAFHKKNGDSVEWVNALTGKYDIVYQSKVFSFTPDIKEVINTKKLIKGGTGYCIHLTNGKEVYHKERNKELPYEIEHIYPDYSLYPELTKNTAYGFLTRGCPRQCDFCHIKDKEGTISYKVADLKEWWNGQTNIELCDPNILACKDWKELLQQLINSKAKVNINQGLDIRLMTKEKAEMLSKLKTKIVHFAWDRYEEKDLIIPKLKMYKEITNCRMENTAVYILTNYDTTKEQDLKRIYTLRDLGYDPYVMIYDKEHCENWYIKLQRWCNNRILFRSCPNFEEVKKDRFLGFEWQESMF